jgi:hypothetical protein
MGAAVATFPIQFFAVGNENMQKGKQNPGQGSTAAAVAPATAAALVERLANENPMPDRFCTELAKIFKVRQTEVALLRLEGGLLKFLFPDELKIAGAIPITSASAVAAHTAVTKKIELFNNFTRVKHASIFESVKLGNPETEQPRPEQAPIQKLISAPVLDGKGKVLGVIQICRKGFDLSSSGPDFTLDDLHQLESASKALSKISFMRENPGKP